MENNLTRPANRIGAWRTDYLTVNGVKVRLVVQVDADGTEFVMLDAEGGYLEGEMPGEYYPIPGERAY